MKRIETVNRTVHIIMCILNLGSIFYALMTASQGTPLYGFFRQLSVGSGVLLAFMRLAYLQYIVFGLIAVIAVIGYIISVKNKEVIKRNICIDAVLWAVTVFELIFLEGTFAAITAF